MNETLEEDGYNSADTSNRTFISFENTSVDFCIPTTTPNYYHSHFAYLFFDYALNSFMTINEALDAASEDVFNEVDFGSCPLNMGYQYSYWFNGTLHEEDCYLRIYGDGDEIIPS
jgi:hypothetical protein